MKHCVSCGHELGVGRFCTNCGHPIGRAPSEPGVRSDVGWRTGTAERPAVPTAPRFPLFADEVPTAAPEVSAYAEHRRPRPPWGMWALVAVVLVLLAGLGIWLLTGDGDSDLAGRAAPAGVAETTAGSSPPATGPGAEPAPAEPSDVTAGASVDAPATAPPGQDVSGNPVDYEPDNMLDGVPETTWRMPGDGSGTEIVLTLPAATQLRTVGLVNGYAKTATDARGRELDWYHGNRRVERVEWVFDDGTTVGQDLQDTTELQSVDVEVTTTTITLRLVTVSAPGTGRAARDYTAISDLSLVGAS